MDRRRISGIFNWRLDNIKHSLKANISDVIGFGLNSRSQRERRLDRIKLELANDQFVEADIDRFGFISDNLSEFDTNDLMQRKGLLGEIESIYLMDTKLGINQRLKNQINPLDSRFNGLQELREQQDRLRTYIEKIDQETNAGRKNGESIKSFRDRQLKNLVESYHIVSQYQFLTRYTELTDKEYQNFLDNEDLLDTVGITSDIQQRYDYFTKGGSLKLYSLDKLKRSITPPGQPKGTIPNLRGVESEANLFRTGTTPTGNPTVLLARQYLDSSAGTKFRSGIGHASLSDIFGMLYDIRHSGLFSSMFQMESDQALVITGIAESLAEARKSDVTVALQASIDTKEYGITATNLVNRALNKLKTIGSSVLDLSGNPVTLPSSRAVGAFEVDDDIQVERNKRLFRAIHVSGYRQLEPHESPETIDRNQTNPILTFVSGSGFQYNYVYSHEKVFGALVNYRASNINNLEYINHKLDTDKQVYGQDIDNLNKQKLVTLGDKISKQLEFDTGKKSITVEGKTIEFLQRVVKRISITSANSTFSAEGSLKDPFTKGLQFNIGQMIDTQQFAAGEYRVLLSKKTLEEAGVIQEGLQGLTNFIPTSMKLLVTRTLESQMTSLYNLLFSPVAGLNKTNFEATALARRRTPNILINDDYLRTLAVTLESMEKTNLKGGSTRAFLTVNAFDLATKGTDGEYIGQAKYLDRLAKEFERAGLADQSKRIRENLELIEFTGQKIRNLAASGQLMLVVGGHKFDQRQSKKIREFLGEDVYKKSVIEMGVQQHSKAGLFYDTSTGKFTQLLGSTNLTIAELSGIAANVALINSNDPNVVGFRMGETREIEYVVETQNIRRERKKIVIDSNKRLLAGTYKKGEGLSEIDNYVNVPMFIRERAVAEMLTLIKDYGAIDLYDFMNGELDINTIETRKALSANAHEAINKYIDSLDNFTRSIYIRRRERRIKQLQSVLTANNLVEDIPLLSDSNYIKNVHSSFGRLTIAFDKDLQDLSVTGQLGNEAIQRVVNKIRPVLSRKGRNLGNVADQVRAIVETSINNRLNRGIVLTPNAAGTELLMIGEGKAARPFIIRVADGADFTLGKQTYKGGQAIFFSEAESAIALQYLLLGEQERILTETLLNKDAIDKDGNFNINYIRNRFYVEFNKARRIILDTQSRPVSGERKQDVVPISVLEVRKEDGLLRLAAAENVQPNDPAFKQSLLLAAEQASEGLFDIHGNKLIDIPITLVQQGARKSKGKVIATVNDELREGIGDTLTAKQIRGMSGFGGIYRSAELETANLNPEELKRRKEQQERMELENQQFLIVGLKGGYKKILSFAQRAAHRSRRIIMEPVSFTLDKGGRFIRTGTISPIVSDNEAIITDNISNLVEYNEKITGMGMVYVSLDPAMNDYGFYSPYLTIGDQRLESAFIKNKFDVSLDTTSNSGQQFKDGYESILAKHGLGVVGKQSNPYEAMIKLLAKAKNEITEVVDIRELDASGIPTSQITKQKVSLFDLAYKSQIVGDDLKIVHDKAVLFVPKGAKKQELYKKRFAIKAYTDYNLILPELGEYIPQLAFTPSGEEIRIKNPTVNAPGAIQMYVGASRTEGAISANFVGIQSPLGRGVGNKGIAIAILEESFKTIGKNINTVFENLGGGTADAFKFAALITHARRVYGNEIELTFSKDNPYQYKPIKTEAELIQRIATVIETREGKTKSDSFIEAKKFISESKQNISDYMVRRVISPRMIKTNESFLQHGAYLLRHSDINRLPTEVENYLSGIPGVKDVIRETIRDSLKTQIKEMVDNANTLARRAITNAIKLEAIRSFENLPNALVASKSERTEFINKKINELQMEFTKIVSSEINKLNKRSTRQILSYEQALESLFDLSPNQLRDIQEQAIGYQRKGIGSTYEVIYGRLMKYGTQSANDFMLGMKAITSSNIQVLKKLVGAGVSDREFAKGIADIIRDTYQYMTPDGRVQLGELGAKSLAIQGKLPKTTADLGLLILANLNIRQQIETNLYLAKDVVNQKLIDIGFDLAGKAEGMFIQHMLSIAGLNPDKTPEEIANVFNKIVKELGLQRLGFAFYADDENIDYSGSFPIGSNSNIFTLSTYYNSLDTSAVRMHPMFGNFAKIKQIEAVRELAFTKNQLLEKKTTSFLDVIATVKHKELIQPAARLQQLVNALSLTNNPNELRQIQQQITTELQKYKLAYNKALLQGMRITDGTDAAILALEAGKKVGTYKDLAGYNTRLAMGHMVSSAANVVIYDIGPDRVDSDGVIRDYTKGKIIKIEPGLDTTYILPDITVLADLPGVIIGDKSISQVGKLLTTQLRITEIYNKLAATEIKVGNNLTKITIADYISGKSSIGLESIEVDNETAQLISELYTLSTEFTDELDNLLASKKTQKKGMGRMGSASGAMVIPVPMRFMGQTEVYVGDVPYSKILGGSDFTGVKSIERQINLIRRIKELSSGGAFFTEFHSDLEKVLDKATIALKDFTGGGEGVRDLNRAIQYIVKDELTNKLQGRDPSSKLVKFMTGRLMQVDIKLDDKNKINLRKLKKEFIKNLKEDATEGKPRNRLINEALAELGTDKFDDVAKSIINRLAQTSLREHYKTAPSLKISKGTVEEDSVLEALRLAKIAEDNFSTSLPNGTEKKFTIKDGLRYLGRGLIGAKTQSTLVNVLRTGSPEGTLAFVQELKPIKELNEKLAAAGLQQLDIEHAKTSAVIGLMLLPFQQGDYDGDMASITVAANVAFLDRKIEQLEKSIEQEIQQELELNPRKTREQILAEYEKLDKNDLSAAVQIKQYKAARANLIDTLETFPGYRTAQQHLLDAASVLIGYRVYTLGEAFANYEFARDQMEFYEKLLTDDKKFNEIRVKTKDDKTTTIREKTLKQALIEDIIYQGNVDRIEFIDSNGVIRSYTYGIVKGILEMMGEQLPIHQTHLKATTDIAKIFGTQLMGQLFDTTHHLFIYNTLLSDSRYLTEASKVASLTQTIGRTSIKKRGESSIAQTVDDFILKFDLLKVELEKELQEKRQQRTGLKVDAISPEFAAGYHIYLRMSGYTGYMDYINYMYQLGEFKNKARVNSARAFTLLVNYGAELGLNYAYNAVTPMSSSSLMGVLEEIGYVYNQKSKHLYLSRDAKKAEFEDLGFQHDEFGKKTNIKVLESQHIRNRKAIAMFSHVIHELNKRMEEPDETNYKAAVEGRLVGEVNPDRGFINALDVIDHLTKDIRSKSAPKLTSSEKERIKHVRERSEKLREALELEDLLKQAQVKTKSDLDITTKDEKINKLKSEAKQKLNQFQQTSMLGSGIEDDELISGINNLSKVYEAALGLNYANALGAINNLESFTPKILTFSNDLGSLGITLNNLGFKTLDEIQPGLVSRVANTYIKGTSTSYLNQKIQEFNLEMERIRFQTEAELQRHISALAIPDDAPEVVRSVIENQINQVQAAKNKLIEDLYNDFKSKAIDNNLYQTLDKDKQSAVDKALRSVAENITNNTDRSTAISDYASLTQTIADAFGLKFSGKNNPKLDEIRMNISESLFNALPQLADALESSRIGFEMVNKVRNDPSSAINILASFESYRGRLKLATAVAEKAGDSLTPLSKVLADEITGRLDVEYSTQIEDILTGRRSVAEVAKEIGKLEVARAQAALGVAQAEGFYKNITDFRQSISQFLDIQYKAAEQAVTSRFNIAAQEAYKQGVNFSPQTQFSETRVAVEQEISRIRKELIDIGALGVGKARTIDTDLLNTQKLMNQDIKTSTNIAAIYSGLSALAALVYGGNIASDLALDRGIGEVFRGSILGGVQIGLMQGGMTFGHLVASSLGQVMRSDLPSNIKARYYASTFINAIIANSIGDVIQNEVINSLTKNVNQMSIKAQRATNQFAFAAGLALNIGIGVIASAVTHGILANVESVREQINAGNSIQELIKADVEATTARIRSYQMNVGRNPQDNDVDIDEFEEISADSTSSVIVATGTDGVGIVSDIATQDVGIDSVYSRLTRYGMLEEHQLQSTYESEVIAIQLGSDPTSEVLLNFISTGDGLSFSEIEVVT